MTTTVSTAAKADPQPERTERVLKGVVKRLTRVSKKRSGTRFKAAYREAADKIREILNESKS